jgi:ComF family protein
LYRSDATRLNPLAVAVQRLKYGGRRVVAATLGDLLAARYPFGAGTVVVPVPLHPHRLRARGFNQALLLARRLARGRRLELAPRALARVRDTTPQADLGAGARQGNVRNAFVVQRPAAVRGRAVVLVDDVLTTGATADACARALCTAGATRVDVYTVARAP